MQSFFNKYRLVKFGDQTYGIRKGWFFSYSFVDIVAPRFSWASSHRFYHTDCRSSDLEKVKSLYVKLKTAYKYVIIEDQYSTEANPAITAPPSGGPVHLVVGRDPLNDQGI